VLEAGQMHALTDRHHLGLVNEQAEGLDGQLVFQLQLLAVERLEAFLGLGQPHLKVLHGVLDVGICLDETCLRLVTAQFDAWSANAVSQPCLNQLQCSDLVRNRLFQVLDVILHVRYQFLQLHAHVAINSALSARTYLQIKCRLHCERGGGGVPVAEIFYAIGLANFLLIGPNELCSFH